ncbi:MAG: aminomethyl-transferring glycine dehydrogenase subunit GcvPA [Firmicutes bacterium]|nr:aminomethyl-transferring glycine dehydrogenase subunit GcvPA [Bacillota bacterium]
MHYIPNTEQERQEMLKAIGAGSIDELFSDIPEEIRLQKELDLPTPRSEPVVFKELKALAKKNLNASEAAVFLGAGTYDHYIPSVVRHILGRSEFYTAYTPYQAEISQGTLQAIYEYQTMICNLTGLDVTNASLYDGATALVEAALMAVGITRREKVVVPASLNPEYRRVLETYWDLLDLECVLADLAEEGSCISTLRDLVDDKTAAVVVQYPNFFGQIEDPRELVQKAHAQGALFIVVANPIALGLLKPPGELGADIACGEGQALGNPMAFGGPHLGYLAAKEKYVRRMPGRIVGATVDSEGHQGYVLTLQAREQHIRRQKATSNICSNQALNALAATVYLSVMGPEGLRQVAESSLAKAHYLYRQLLTVEGISPGLPGPFFHEFTVRVQGDPEEIFQRLAEYGLIGGLPLGRFYPQLSDLMLFCVTEQRTKEEMDYLVQVLGGLL